MKPERTFQAKGLICIEDALINFHVYPKGLIKPVSLLPVVWNYGKKPQDIWGTCRIEVKGDRIWALMTLDLITKERLFGELPFPVYAGPMGEGKYNVASGIVHSYRLNCVTLGTHPASDNRIKPIEIVE